MRELRLDKRFNTKFTTYTKEIKKNRYAPMSAKEEAQAFIKYGETKDPAIKEKIVNSNIRFAFAVAKQYCSQNNDDLLLDLVQEANMGLVEAVDKFDVHQGFKFISFAVWICRKNCIAYLSTSYSQIRIPVNVSQYERILILLSNNFLIKNGYPPSEEDLVVLFKEKINHRKGNPNYEKIVSDFFSYKISLSSLDQVYTNDEEGEHTLKDNIEQSNNNYVKDFLKEDNTNFAINKLLKNLSNKERDFIEWKFGINNHNISEIESKYKIDSTDYRSLYTNIIRKIKISSNKDKKFFNSEIFV